MSLSQRQALPKGTKVYYCGLFNDYKPDLKGTRKGVLASDSRARDHRALVLWDGSEEPQWVRRGVIDVLRGKEK